jgi:hypothetical protein
MAAVRIPEGAMLARIPEGAMLARVTVLAWVAMLARVVGLPPLGIRQMAGGQRAGRVVLGGLVQMIETRAIGRRAFMRRGCRSTVPALVGDGLGCGRHAVRPGALDCRVHHGVSMCRIRRGRRCRVQQRPQDISQRRIVQVRLWVVHARLVGHGTGSPANLALVMLGHHRGRRSSR